MCRICCVVHRQDPDSRVNEVDEEEFAAVAVNEVDEEEAADTTVAEHEQYEMIFTFFTLILCRDLMSNRYEQFISECKRIIKSQSTLAKVIVASTTTSTFIAVVDLGMHISFLFTRCRYLSIFYIFLLSNTN